MTQHTRTTSWIKSFFGGEPEPESHDDAGNASDVSSLSSALDQDEEATPSSSSRSRRKARLKADKDPNILQRAAKSAQHYGASLFEHQHSEDSMPTPAVAIPGPHNGASAHPAPLTSTTHASSSPPSLNSLPSTSPIAPSSSSPRPSSRHSISFKGVGATLSTIHSRYSMRRQASQTFKEMQDKQGKQTLPEPQRPLPTTEPRRSVSVDQAFDSSPKQPLRPSLEHTLSESHITQTPPDAPSPPPTSAPPLLVMPKSLEGGQLMLKVTHKKVMQRVIRLDADRGQILWASKKGNRINLETVREVRIGASGASFRTSLNISAAHEPRWISIIYQQGAAYKALHLIALSDESLAQWRDALERLQGLRRQLFGSVTGHAAGLGLDVADLQSTKNDVWLRQHWKTADSSADERLDPDEVVRLCRRLGIESSRKDLKERFSQADWRKRGYLDFEDFQLFVRLLKRRTEVEDLFALWADTEIGTSSEQFQARSEDARAPPSACIPQPAMSLDAFRRFLAQEQQDPIAATAEAVFVKYSSKLHGLLLLDGFTSFLQSADNFIVKDAVMVLPSGSQTGASEQAANAFPSRQARATADTAEALLAAEAQAQHMSDDKKFRVAPQDMRRPLSEYFISSSHNTYLVGGQWKGDSTVEGYIRALQHGARSVELDCWDGPHGQPQITHGRTLTSRVAFLDVITAIARYAFVTSPYPLILSLEIHNDVPQQTVMAGMLRDVLGDALLTEKLPDEALHGLCSGGVVTKPAIPAGALPSPEDLRGKILVKAKNILISSSASGERASLEADADVDQEAFIFERQTSGTSTTSNAETTGSESDGFLANAKGLVRSVTRGKRGHGSGDTSTRGGEGLIGAGLLSPSGSSSSSSATSSTGVAKSDHHVKSKKVLFSPELASLLVYTIGVKHRGINKKETYAPEHMISLSERTAFKYVRDRWNREDLIKHNRSHLTRVYPSMSSIARLHASANYLPHHIWAVGCQLVALNWQTIDLGFALNQAMFNRNAGTGYVLKPTALRVKAPASAKEGGNVRCQLEIEVVSAQQLPRFRDVVRDKESTDGDVLDPFITVSLFTPESWGRQDQVQQQEAGGATGLAVVPSSSPIPSTSATSRPFRQSTHVVRGNGFNPIWNSTLRFGIQVPVPWSVPGSEDDVHKNTQGLLDLAFLRFEVCDDTSQSPPSSSSDSSADQSTPNSTQDSSSSSSSSASSSSSQVLATYTISVGALQMGYRHLPLYDGQLQQYPFSTLFVRSRLRAR